MEMASKMFSTACRDRRSMDSQCSWAAVKASTMRCFSWSKFLQRMPSSVRVKEGLARDEWE